MICPVALLSLHEHLPQNMYGSHHGSESQEAGAECGWGKDDYWETTVTLSTPYLINFTESTI